MLRNVIEFTFSFDVGGLAGDTNIGQRVITQPGQMFTFFANP